MAIFQGSDNPDGWSDITRHAADTFYGAGGNDTINAFDYNDLLYGGGLRDYLNGGTGADIIYGGQDSDSLIGDHGQDQLYGGAGADELRGGPGVDMLYGGAGADSFFFGPASTGAGPGNRDVIHGFESYLVGERIDLRNNDANIATTDRLEQFTSVVESASFPAPGQVAFTHTTGDTWIVRMNCDSDPDPEQAIEVHVAGGGSLTVNDFLIH